MEPLILVTLTVRYWTADKQWAGAKATAARITENEIALKIDGVYSDLQEQVNQVGGFITVVPSFESPYDYLEKQHPPKILTPINKIRVPILTPLGVNN